MAHCLAYMGYERKGRGPLSSLPLPPERVGVGIPTRSYRRGLLHAVIFVMGGLVVVAGG